MRTYKNGESPNGTELYCKIVDRQMTRVFLRGDAEILAKLQARLKGCGTELTQMKDGSACVDFSLIPDEQQFTVATTLRLDQFSSLEISTNEA